MTCPVPNDVLFAYWLGDDHEAIDDALEQHLLSCARCSEASGRVAALVQGLREAVPPIALRDDILLAEARGVRTIANDFLPDVAAQAWLGPSDDMLVHRLIGDLSDVTHVAVDLLTTQGMPFLSFGDVPFDRDAGAVLIACGRYFTERFDEPDMGVRVRLTHEGGDETTTAYMVQHRFGAREAPTTD